ncbi:MAG: ABC transporter ATP-binding protein [Lentimicrobiaceae bacterium]|nr:ABC transporter ATP-binding protein [Lentimicrobiaceae bacterium]
MNTLKRFKIYMGKRKILLPISLVLSALNGLLALVPAVLVWFIVRTLILSDGSPEGTAVNQYAWWAFAAAVFSVLLYFVVLMLSHLAAFRVECNLRTTAVNRLLRMPLGFFDSKASGRIRKIIDDDAGNTHTFLAHILPDLAASIVSPVLVFVLLFVFDWRMGVACLIPIGITVVIMRYMMDSESNHFMKDYLTAQEQMSAEAVEYVRGIPVVKVFQQTVFSFRRFYDSIIRYRDLVIPYTLTWRNPMSIYTAVINGFAFFLIPLAVLLIGRGGELSVVVSDLLFYLLITPIIGANVMKIMYLQNNLFLAGEALTRIENITSTPPLPEAAQTQSIKKHDIEFDNVRFSYPEATIFAVDGVSFHIPQGSTYALVGQSGGGKTTIARLIPRFWDVAEGCVKIGGEDVRDIAKEELMENVSFVFQNSKLFKTTILENITYGKPDSSPAEIKRAIDLSQSREIINRLPNGLLTKIGVDGTYLSGGEQQRIVLARAFLKDAPIVVLDEATAFADPENEHLIQQALSELMKGKTVLMIAHRLTTVQDADKILVIDKGKIAEQGTHSELIAKNGIYSSMWDEYQKAVAWTF